MEMIELSAFECLISEMRGKAKLKLIIFDSYVVLNTEEWLKEKHDNFLSENIFNSFLHYVTYLNPIIKL